METPNRIVLPERNPVTYSQHKREVFWQITIPMAIGILLVLLGVVAVLIAATQPTSELSRWADVSLIWLIIPSLFIGLIFLVILATIVYLIIVVLRITPRYSHLILLYLEIGKYKVIRISNQITNPIVKTRSMWAVARHPGRFGKPPHEHP